MSSPSFPNFVVSFLPGERSFVRLFVCLFVFLSNLTHLYVAKKDFVAYSNVPAVEVKTSECSWLICLTGWLEVELTCTVFPVFVYSQNKVKPEEDTRESAEPARSALCS